MYSIDEGMAPKTVCTCPPSRSVSAGSILDEEWLAKPLGQPLTHQARHDVERAAGRKTDHDAHGPYRIGLRLRDPRHGRQRGCARGQMQECATGKFHGVPLPALR